MGVGWSHGGGLECVMGEGSSHGGGLESWGWVGVTKFIVLWPPAFSLRYTLAYLKSQLKR